MAQHLVVEFLQRPTRAFLLLVITAQFQDLQLAECVVEVFRIVGAARRLGSRRLFLVVTVLLKEFCSLFNSHALAVHLTVNVGVGAGSIGLFDIGTFDNAQFDQGIKSAATLKVNAFNVLLEAGSVV